MSKINEKTNEIVFNGLFEKGMIFQEMLTFWLGILDITDDGIIITLEGNRIQDMKLKKYIFLMLLIYLFFYQFLD